MPAQLDSAVLQAWEHVASTFFKQAIFSYLTHPVADVVEYFDVSFPQQAPLIAAHLPASDAKFKSTPLRALDSATLFEFVAGVVTGKTEKIIKSEPVPKLTGPPPLVLTAVGSNVRVIVSVPGKDVLLLVYTPWCAQCKQLIPAFDVLGRAVQGEPRIVLAKINAAANDIPASWGVKGHPMLLWFRAADKEGNGDASTALIPRSYWDAGYSLQELAGFVQRQGSFDPRTLKVASSEQLMSLQGDEAALREKYEVEERHQMRNKDRAVYEAPLLDFLAGEIVFDGTRVHMLLVCVLGAACVAMGAYIILLKLSAAAGAPVRVTKRKDS
jgi:thiol-disulfide isomerase/thioredoxin